MATGTDTIVVPGGFDPGKPPLSGYGFGAGSSDDGDGQRGRLKVFLKDTQSLLGRIVGSGVDERGEASFL